MSWYDYQRSLEMEREPFYGIIMAAMREADDDNRAKLRAMWPDVWNELSARYHAPGGLLAGEEDAEGT